MPPSDEQFEGLEEMPRSELGKGSRIVQIAALLEQHAAKLHTLDGPPDITTNWRTSM
jgi:hypothetical protein